MGYSERKIVSFSIRNDTEDEQLHGIGTDQKGLVYLLDSRRLVHIFVAEGKFILKFATESWESPLAPPRGLAVDTHGSIYLCESRTHHVAVYQNDGKLQRQLRNCQVREPSGIALSADGKLVFVADAPSKRVYAFTTEEGKLSHYIGQNSTHSSRVRLVRYGVIEMV